VPPYLEVAAAVEGEAAGLIFGAPVVFEAGTGEAADVVFAAVGVVTAGVVAAVVPQPVIIRAQTRQMDRVGNNFFISILLYDFKEIMSTLIFSFTTTS